MRRFKSRTLSVAIIAIVGLLNLIASANCIGQEVEVQVATEDPPFYVGVGAIVQLTVTGLDEEPTPKCELMDVPDGLIVNLTSVNPRILTQQFLSGGRVRIAKRVTYNIRYQVIADKAGKYRVGPFKISQGKTTKQVDAFEMSFQDVPTSDDMTIRLILPESAYPDQRVPVKIEWAFNGDLDNLREPSIRSKFFDQFSFAPDDRPRRGVSQLPIQTAQGEVSINATARREQDGDAVYTILTAQRTLIPDRPGKFEIDPVTATIQLVTRWRERRGSGFPSLFDDVLGGQRTPAKIELFRTESDKQTFTVKPFPKQDQPESFAGTVGKGFSLDVAADRTVVRVGDPIRLTIRLRGDGNIEGASLPRLSADGGLDPSRFRVPDEDIAGELRDGAKEFLVSVRVKDEGVSEIPGISYSWFDTETETYATTRSDPIALRVNPTQIVGADAVVRGGSAKSMQTANDSSKSLSTAFSLTGADLAIETDTIKLVVGSENLLQRPVVQGFGYVLGIAIVLTAWLDRRRRQVDPETKRTELLLSQSQRRIEAAKKLSPKDAASEVANVLRGVIAEFPDTNNVESRRLLAECEELLFRPGQTDSLASEFYERAKQAIQGLGKQRVSA